MKCNNCQEELVIPEGRKAGHCMSCGASFTLDSKTGAQILDSNALKSLAVAIVDEQELRAAAIEKEKDDKKKKKKGDDGNGNGGNKKDKWDE